MSDKEKIELLTSELRFTIKALKGIAVTYDMEVMAKDLLSTRIINLEAKLNNIQYQDDLARVKILCA
jgi:hypothetical protein